MKDIVITVKQQKREIKYFLISFLLAVCINVYAIIHFDTNFRELYTQLFIVLMVTIFIYLLTALFRFVYHLIVKNRKPAV